MSPFLQDSLPIHQSLVTISQYFYFLSSVPSLPSNLPIGYLPFQVHPSLFSWSIIPHSNDTWKHHSCQHPKTPSPCLFTCTLHITPKNLYQSGILSLIYLSALPSTKAVEENSIADTSDVHSCLLSSAVASVAFPILSNTPRIQYILPFPIFASTPILIPPQQITWPPNTSLKKLTYQLRTSSPGSHFPFLQSQIQRDHFAILRHYVPCTPRRDKPTNFSFPLEGARSFPVAYKYAWALPTWKLILPWLYISIF